jgi:pimeloyl-ACP methyl ester carboxylesterase
MLTKRAAAVLLLAFAAGLNGGGTASADTDFAGLIPITPDRSLFLDCQGSGSPTVLVIPGKGSYAEAWNVVVPADDPIRSSPYDIITEAKFVPSSTATQPTVAKTTRVCVYDRPNTRPDGVDRSTLVPQPHTVQQDVDDVVALIAAAHLATPLVIVAHSYGGLIADLLARTHPELVSALVFVEPTSEFIPAVGRPDQNAAFETDSSTPTEPGAETVLPDDAFAAIAVAPPLPRVPAIVLSGDKFPAPEAVKPDNYTQAQVHQANDMLAESLGTTNVIVPGSGHNMMLYQPQATAEHIVAMVDQVRAGA